MTRTDMIKCILRHGFFGTHQSTQSTREQGGPTFDAEQLQRVGQLYQQNFQEQGTGEN